jgi:tRNA A-37 threonylcarbamoyl transferase component Bud32
MEFLDLALKYIVVPALGFIWILHNKVQDQGTDLAVLKATTAANKEAHDKEFKAIQDSFKAMMSKLDSIEEALRK